MKQRKSDILWKVIIEDVFADLLRFIFTDADVVYDMERGFEFLDKELAELHPQPDEEKDSRFADKLVKVFHRDGGEEWVLLHIEVQGDTSARDAFAERMFTYFYRIWDRYRRPVSALAIFTGQDGKKMPDMYRYEYRNTRLTYEYLGISILDYSDEELDASNNPFAQVVAAAKLRLLEQKLPDDKLLDIKLMAAERLRARGFAKEKIIAILGFLRNYILFEDPKMNRKFDYQFNETAETLVMNTEEWLKMYAAEQAREETIDIFVANLIKGTDFDSEKIASLAGATVEDVDDMRERLRRAESKKIAYQGTEKK